jgi:hypothetical protein
VRTLFGGKGPLYRAVKVFGLVQASDLAQASAFRLQTLLNFIFFFNLNEISRHSLPPAFAWWGESGKAAEMKNAQQ